MRLRPSSSLIITVLGLITVIPSMLQLPIATANYSTATTDAFFLAMVVPTLVSGPLFNAVSSTLVPALCRTQASQNQGEARFARSVTTILNLATLIGSLLIATSISILSYWHAHWIPGFASTKVSTFIWWLIPWVLLQSPVTILQGVALTTGKPWLPSLAGLVQQVTITSLLYGLSGMPGSTGLPVSYIIGCAVQAVVLVALLPGSLHLLRPALTQSEPVRDLLASARPVWMGTLALQAGAVATRVIASSFGVGTITALECAAKLSNTLIDITCNGVLTTSFSRWSHIYARNSTALLRSDFIRTVQLALLTLSPLCVALFAARVPVLVSWLSKLHLIDPSIVILSAEFFGILALAVPLEAAGRLSVRLYLASHDTRTPSLLGIARMITSLILILIFSPILSALSLALADSIGSLLTLVCLLRWPSNQIRNTLGPIIKTLGVMAMPLALGWLSGYLVQNSFFAKIPMVNAMVSITFTITTYALFFMVLNPKETAEALQASRLLLSKQIDPPIPPS